MGAACGVRSISSGRVPDVDGPDIPRCLARIRGNAVVLLERRPHFQDRKRHTEHPFAKFVYSPTIGGWSLKWRDRNERWHAYEGFEDVAQFRDVLREVEADPTCIFLG